MITRQDLQEAIAECEGARNPNANTCIKLAAFYTIRQQLFGGEQAQREPSFSYSGPAITHGVEYENDTDFARAIHGKDSDTIWALMDELMGAIQVLNPKLYNSVMARIQSIHSH